MKKKIINDISGLSLIEIMVAFSILTVAYIAIMASFPTALSINKGAESSTLAAYLAQQKIEELSSMPYDSIATGTIEALHNLSADSSNYLYFFERQTDVSYIDGNLAATTTDLGIKKISTTVYYTDASTRTKKPYVLTILNSQK